MSIKHFLEILRARIWLILLLPCLAAAIAYTLTDGGPVLYASNATILLDYRKPLEGELAGELLPVGLQESYMSTQVDIIKSRAVVEKVMRLLSLRDSPDWHGLYEQERVEGQTFDGWAMSRLLQYLTVVVGTESRLIEIWYRAPTPTEAAAIANAFVDAYREVYKELDQNPAMATAESVETALSGLRSNLAAVEAKVSRYQAERGILATDERLDVETTHLNELMQQKLAAEAALREAKSQKEALEEMIATGATADSASAVLRSGLIQNLQVDVTRKESELAEMSTNLGSRHPQILELKAELRSLRAKLAAETKKVLNGMSSDWSQAQRVYDSASAAEAAQRTKLLKLKEAREGLQPLLREQESAKASYDRALGMYSEYAMHSNVNYTNVYVLNSAQPSGTPTTPSLMRNVGSAFVAGLVFAFGLVLLWELMDRRVRGREDLSDIGGAGFLGALPKA